ncbi:Tat pathway signal protein [Acetobacteraceae bacterium H6797]|nr:Tat pathway signal protein [Acetobacteraceae bacterium H6797]
MRSLIAALFGLIVLSLAAPAEAQNRFWLENNTGRTIQEAYVSSSRVNEWGRDILGDTVLEAGSRVHVTPSFSDCVLDIRVVYQGGGNEERRNVNACQLSRIAFGTSSGSGAVITGKSGGAAPRGGDPSFSFINGTGQTVQELYVSLSTNDNWGRDRLGSNVLNPGQSNWVSLPGGGTCTVDIRVVYASGRSAEQRGVNTCNLSELRWR